MVRWVSPAIRPSVRPFEDDTWPNILTSCIEWCWFSRHRCLAILVSHLSHNVIWFDYINFFLFLSQLAFRLDHHRIQGGLSPTLSLMRPFGILKLDLRWSLGQLFCFLVQDCETRHNNEYITQYYPDLSDMSLWTAEGVREKNWLRRDNNGLISLFYYYDFLSS